jgi:hypothetical protein
LLANIADFWLFDKQRWSLKIKLDMGIYPTYSIWMPQRLSKKPADMNALAQSIVDKATMQKAAQEGKDPVVVILGRLGGLKVGKAKAKTLSAERRSEIAKNAARMRWQNK